MEGFHLYIRCPQTPVFFSTVGQGQEVVFNHFSFSFFEKLVFDTDLKCRKEKLEQFNVHHVCSYQNGKMGDVKNCAIAIIARLPDPDSWKIQ